MRELTEREMVELERGMEALEFAVRLKSALEDTGVPGDRLRGRKIGPCRWMVDADRLLDVRLQPLVCRPIPQW